MSVTPALRKAHENYKRVEEAKRLLADAQAFRARTEREDKETFGDYLVERVARKLCEQCGCDPDYTPQGWPHPNWRHARHVREAKEIVEVIFGTKPIYHRL